MALLHTVARRARRGVGIGYAHAQAPVPRVSADRGVTAAVCIVCGGQRARSAAKSSAKHAGEKSSRYPPAAAAHATGEQNIKLTDTDRAPPPCRGRWNCFCVRALVNHPVRRSDHPRYRPIAFRFASTGAAAGSITRPSSTPPRHARVRKCPKLIFYHFTNKLIIIINGRLCTAKSKTFPTHSTSIVFRQNRSKKSFQWEGGLYA